MTAIESLPAYREAEVAAKRRGENLGSLIDAFLAGYARGACPTPTTLTYWTIRGRHTAEPSSSTSWMTFS